MNTQEIHMRFDGLIQCPNSGNSDVITVQIDLEDKDLNAGQIMMVGPYGAINQIDASDPLVIDGINAIEPRSNSFGQEVTFATNFDTNYNAYWNVGIRVKVTDHEGFSNVPNDHAEGLTNLLMIDKSTKFQQVHAKTEQGEYIRIY